MYAVGSAGTIHDLSGDWPMPLPGMPDAHFEANRPEYEAAVRSAGLRPGWHILDVGCGVGSFLPLLADQAGPGGRVTAVDRDPAALAVAADDLAARAVPCPVSIGVGGLPALPFPDAQFDAAWCANALPYLDDAILPAALSDLRRVLRPAGLLVVLETDVALCLPSPVDLAHYAPVIRACCAHLPGAARARGLRPWLLRAGLTDVRQRIAMITRHAPLRPIERQSLGDHLALLARVAEGLVLPAEARAFWRAQRDPAAAVALVNREDFTWCEALVTLTARR
jgi:SAM-dependent methyltransferase